MEVFSLTNPSQFSGNQTFRLAHSLTFENFGGPDDFRKAFVSFFLSDTNSLHQIKSLLKAVNTTHEYCFEVDYFNLCSFSSPLSRMVLKHSLIYAVVEAALVEAQLKVKQAEPDPSVRSAMTLKGADEDSFTQKESQSQSQAQSQAENSSQLPTTILPQQSSNIHIRFTSIPPHYEFTKPSASDINAGDVGNKLQVSGTVIRTSQIRLMKKIKAFRCLAPRCGFVHMIYADMECSDNDIVDPTICNNELNVRGVEKPCGGNKFAEDLMLSRDGDYQEMKIQESVTNLGVGIIPRSLCVVLEHDLVDACKPGDDVNVCGTLMARWGPHAKDIKFETQIILRADSVSILNSESSVNWEGVGGVSNGADLGVRESLKTSFKNFWAKKHNAENPIAARNYICRAVCPKLYGMLTLKLSLLLTLIGGVGGDDELAEDEVELNGGTAAPTQTKPPPTPAPKSAAEAIGSPPQKQFWESVQAVMKKEESSTGQQQQNQHDNPSMPPPPAKQGGKPTHAAAMRRRSQSHMLMIGDPGTGKSQFLRFANALSPRCVLTTGVGTTSAGLTCSAVKDKNEWQLEAGALVLADLGVCCIDEFGCISDKDRTTIHEAMEQQCLSVAKAGLVCKLNCRASILATTNPKGHYDLDKTLSENTGIGTPLLSRFDLIFVLVDSPDNAERDGKIATFLLNHAINGSMASKKAAAAAKKNDTTNSHLFDDDDPEATCNSVDKTWSIEKLRGYIASIKESYNPTLSTGARILLTRHYSECRTSGQKAGMSYGGGGGPKATVRLLESLIRLSQAHARLMMRHVVEVGDAVAVILIMECSANVLGGLDQKSGFGFYSNPMESEFPNDDKADAEFQYMQDQLLTKYELMPLIGKPNGPAGARANLPHVSMFGITQGTFDGTVDFENDDIFGPSSNNSNNSNNSDNMYVDNASPSVAPLGGGGGGGGSSSNGFSSMAANFASAGMSLRTTPTRVTSNDNENIINSDLRNESIVELAMTTSVADDTMITDELRSVKKGRTKPKSPKRKGANNGNGNGNGNEEKNGNGNGNAEATEIEGQGLGLDDLKPATKGDGDDRSANSSANGSKGSGKNGKKKKKKPRMED